MSCNSRVVMRTTLSAQNIADIKKIAKEMGWKVVGDKIIMSPMVNATLEGNTLTLRSQAEWDLGVTQLKSIIVLLSVKGVKFEKVDQPETHIHQPTAPQQRVGH
ncbi:MAG: hypothetical protein PHI12_08335 [Dehalococcoidales bacterium]|nr:hypothetical protein [Dehalococcoidales bacterium]